MNGDQLVMDLRWEQGPGRETQVQPPIEVWRQYFRVDLEDDEFPAFRLINTRAPEVSEPPRQVVLHHHNLTVEVGGAIAPRPAIVRFTEIGRNRYEYAVYRPEDEEYDTYDQLLKEVPNPYRTRADERRWFIARRRRQSRDADWPLRAKEVDERVRERRRAVAEDDEVAAARNAIAELAGQKAEGQGYESFSSRRKAIEDHAMRRATAYYRNRGWSVMDVSATRSYDLLCTRGGGRERLHVEVKGTTSPGGSVLVTRNEVEHAKGAYPHTALFILANVRVVPDDPLRATRGNAITRQPWDPEEGRLEPLAYKYELP